MALDFCGSTLHFDADARHAGFWVCTLGLVWHAALLALHSPKILFNVLVKATSKHLLRRLGIEIDGQETIRFLSGIFKEAVKF